MAEDDDHRRVGEVGFGRPPEEHRVKPGETRNPWGRKGKPKPKTDFMDELVEIRVDGKDLKVTREMALDYALFQAAVKGNVSAVKEAERRRKERARIAVDDEADALLSDEKAALERLIQRRLEEHRANENPAPKPSPHDVLEQLKSAAREVAPGGKT